MSFKTVVITLLLMLNLFANERIVSLSPSITEILFALNKGKDIVATSDFLLYPNEATALPKIGSYSNPNIEKIISYEPTLVIGQEFHQKSLRESRHFGIKSIELDLQTIPAIKESINKLSKALHVEQNAKRLIQEIDDALNSVKNEKSPHTVLIVYGLKEDLRSGIYVAGDKIFFNDIIEACGETNAYKDSFISQPVLGYENIIALNPEQIIILHSKKSAPHVDVKRALQSWRNIPTRASKNSKISVVDESYIHIPSHRVALTIKRLCKEMHND